MEVVNLIRPTVVRVTGFSRQLIIKLITEIIIGIIIHQIYYGG